MKKRIVVFATLCLLVGLAVVPACAQETVYRAMVPFSFVVLGRTLPAGEYSLTVAPHMLTIKNASGTPVAEALANQIVGRSSGVADQIIFHCYGERCFLSELRSPIQGGGRQLVTSRAEAELAKKEQGKYFAVLGQKPRQ